MSNWDLMMPGMGLTAIGLAGVILSYSGIAHTFIDGMHALTGLTMFFGLIFLSAGILDGGVSTSNRAKATVLVITSIALSFGMFALASSTIGTLPVFAGIMIILVTPAVVTAYVYHKMPQYAKATSTIFILATATAIITYIAFGIYGPGTYLIDEKVIEEIIEEMQIPSGTPVFSMSILEGSSEQGMPDYEPDVARVPQGHVIEWTNDDSFSHTVTSSLDYAKCVDIATVASIKELWKTASIAIASPIVLGILLGPTAVAGLLMGAVVSGIFLAFHLANTGGAWDNAKKLIEMKGERGSEIHKVAVVGDIIGDPYKDTAGPALNTVIKLLNTVAIVFVSAFIAVLAL